jgi:DNA modification methylase
MTPELSRTLDLLERIYGVPKRIWNTYLFHGDARECLPLLPNAAFDLVLTDPPYGVEAPRFNFGHRVEKDRTAWDARPEPEVIRHLLRVGRRVMLFGGNYFADCLPVSRSWIFWDKTEAMHGRSFGDGELIWSNLDQPVRRVRVAPFIRAEKRRHPTQKPVELLRALLSMAGTGGVVFDPFAGSGSLADACFGTSWAMIGIEREAGFFEKIRRWAEELAPLPLAER